MADSLAGYSGFAHSQAQAWEFGFGSSSFQFREARASSLRFPIWRSGTNKMENLRMKKYLSVGFLLLSLSYVPSIQAAFENYDTTVLGSLSWGGSENFWIHNYWYPECVKTPPSFGFKSCPKSNVGATHTGRDYHPRVSIQSDRLNRMGLAKLSI
jgi:hypothetical protein